MRLAKTDLQRILKAIAAALPPSKDRGTLEAITDAYHAALGLMPLEDVQRAADEIVRNDRWFPAPSRFWKLAKEWQKNRPIDPSSMSLAQRSGHWQSEGDWHIDPCPVCGSVLTVLPTGRYGMVHDSEQHRAAGIGHAGAK